MSEQVVHAITHCVTHFGFKAWELVFTTRRIILVKKSRKEALSIGAVAGGYSGAGLPGLAESRLSRGALAHQEELQALIGREGIAGLSREPGSVMIENSEVEEIFLKETYLGAPEIRILTRRGKRWVIGLYDMQPAMAHLEPLRAVFGLAVRHNLRPGMVFRNGTVFKG